MQNVGFLMTRLIYRIYGMPISWMLSFVPFYLKMSCVMRKPAFCIYIYVCTQLIRAFSSCQTWSETLMSGFLMTRLKKLSLFCIIKIVVSQVAPNHVISHFWWHIAPACGLLDLQFDLKEELKYFSLNIIQTFNRIILGD